MTKSYNDEFYMRRALDLAVGALGRTSPNPVVGAVIVKNDQIIGEGYHMKAGTPHAEIHALRSAGEAARGATIYVSLEPCSHYGKTPPCADALIEAGLEKVVIATTDPNPRVAGKGILKLNNAGIETKTGVLEEDARKINEVFFKYIQTGMPFVALKTAMTLDGKIATSNGDSKWITGADSREYVHKLRNTYDGILVGIGTVLQDNPQLNTRLETEDCRDPVRIIIDENLDIPVGSNIITSSQKQRTLIFCSIQTDVKREELLLQYGAEIIRLASKPGQIPLEDVLRYLADNDICSILVEGGAQINGYLLQNRLIDKVYWFIAPKIVGGKQAPSPIGGQGIQTMNEALEIKGLELHRFEKDILLTGYLK